GTADAATTPAALGDLRTDCNQPSCFLRHRIKCGPGPDALARHQISRRRITRYRGQASTTAKDGSAERILTTNHVHRLLLPEPWLSISRTLQSLAVTHT